MLPAGPHARKDRIPQPVWDLDGSGSDVFTFAYYDGLAADAVPTPSTCEDGKPRNDGSIDIDIRIGTPVYDYAHAADTVAGVPKDEIIASGKFTGEAHRIDGLAPGTYTLKVTQGGGNDIYGTGGPLYATYVHDKRIFASGEVSWTVTEPTPTTASVWNREYPTTSRSSALMSEVTRHI